jgi:predicted RNA-binding Zn-ribbon protein involved in translation (DUF1610 family)
MPKVERSTKVTGKEAIFVDPVSGEVLISEPSFKFIKHKREDYIKAGNLLRRQDLYVEEVSNCKKILMKVPVGQPPRVFAEVLFDVSKSRWWVLRYDLTQPVDVVGECSQCGEMLSLDHSVEGCPVCGSAVLACRQCVYRGQEHICKNCNKGSLFVDIYAGGAE